MKIKIKKMIMKLKNNKSNRIKMIKKTMINKIIIIIQKRKIRKRKRKIKSRKKKKNLIKYLTNLNNKKVLKQIKKLKMNLVKTQCWVNFNKKKERRMNFQ